MEWQNLSTGMFTVVRNCKGLLRLERDNIMKLKAKTAQVILLDANSLSKYSSLLLGAFMTNDI